MPMLTYLHEKTNKKRHELYLMIAMGLYYEGVRKGFSTLCSNPDDYDFSAPHYMLFAQVLRKL